MICYINPNHVFSCNLTSSKEFRSIFFCIFVTIFSLYDWPSKKCYYVKYSNPNGIKYGRNLKRLYTCNTIDKNYSLKRNIKSICYFVYFVWENVSWSRWQCYFRIAGCHMSPPPTTGQDVWKDPICQAPSSINCNIWREPVTNNN